MEVREVASSIAHKAHKQVSGDGGSLDADFFQLLRHLKLADRGSERAGGEAGGVQEEYLLINRGEVAIESLCCFTAAEVTWCMEKCTADLQAHTAPELSCTSGCAGGVVYCGRRFI